ncbi:MAG: hypothetical protein ACRCV9_17880 [Burkholderiaceae bacterium]
MNENSKPPSAPGLQRYLIETPVLETHGVQVWEVVATSESEALLKFEKNDGVTFHSEEIEVLDIGKPVVSMVEPIGEAPDAGKEAA